MFNKLEARVLSEYKWSRAAPSTFYTLIKHCFSFIKHYVYISCTHNSEHYVYNSEHYVYFFVFNFSKRQLWVI